MVQAGVGERPTVFVCYSMGGLVLKKILEIYPKVGQSTKGVVFLATPHHGSPTAETSNEDTWTYLAKVVKTFVTPEVLLLGLIGYKTSLIPTKRNSEFQLFLTWPLILYPY